MDKLVRLAPLAVIAGFCASIVFAAGYFYFPGVTWISILTLPDLFSLSWIVAASTSVGVCIAILSGPLGTTSATFHKLEEVTKKFSDRGKFLSFVFQAYLLFIYLSPALIGLSLYLFIFFSKPNSAAYFLIPGLISIPVLDIYIDYYMPSERKNRARSALLVYMAFILLFSTGVLISSNLMQFKHPDTIHFSDRPDICANIIFAGERGIIYSRPPKFVGLLRWDHVLSFERETGCKMPAAAPRPEVKLPQTDAVNRGHGNLGVEKSVTGHPAP